MTHIQPAIDGIEGPGLIPVQTRRKVDAYEEWVDEVWPAFVAAADSGEPFTIDAIARDKNLPDPPNPKSQWGHLPGRLQDAGIIRHHSFGRSGRCRQSLVYVWIGVPTGQREAVAERRRIERAAARAEKRAAA